MKKIILLAGAAMMAIVVAGCNRENQGGTSDEYGTSTGSETNYQQSVNPATNSYNNTENGQGSATSPGGTNSATGAGVQ